MREWEGSISAALLVCDDGIFVGVVVGPSAAAAAAQICSPRPLKEGRGTYSRGGWMPRSKGAALVWWRGAQTGFWAQQKISAPDSSRLLAGTMPRGGHEWGWPPSCPLLGCVCLSSHAHSSLTLRFGGGEAGASADNMFFRRGRFREEARGCQLSSGLISERLRRGGRGLGARERVSQHHQPRFPAHAARPRRRGAPQALSLRALSLRAPGALADRLTRRGPAPRRGRGRRSRGRRGRRGARPRGQEGLRRGVCRPAGDRPRRRRAPRRPQPQAPRRAARGARGRGADPR